MNYSIEDLIEQHKALTKNTNALSSSEKYELSKSIESHIRNSNSGKMPVELIYTLANDENDDVRNEIANCLPFVSDSDFNKLSLVLSKDKANYVRKSVMRAEKLRKSEKQRMKRTEATSSEEINILNDIKKRYDIDAEKLARKAVEQRAKTMANSTIHELRKLITPIKSKSIRLTDLMKEGKIDKHQFISELETVINSTDAIEKMLEGLYHSTNTVEMFIKEISISEVINNAVAQVQNYFEGEEIDISNIELAVNIHEDISISLSKNHVCMALNNLIKNAIESFEVAPRAFNKGKVEISTQVEGNILSISVKDNGFGLSSEELNFIRRFESGHSSKHNGHGHGLPIARNYIRAHDGYLHINSIENEGTTVTITLPITKEDK